MQGELCAWGYWQAARDPSSPPESSAFGFVLLGIGITKSSWAKLIWKSRAYSDWTPKRWFHSVRFLTSSGMYWLAKCFMVLSDAPSPPPLSLYTCHWIEVMSVIGLAHLETPLAKLQGASPVHPGWWPCCSPWRDAGASVLEPLLQEDSPDENSHCLPFPGGTADRSVEGVLICSGTSTENEVYLKGFYRATWVSGSKAFVCLSIGGANLLVALFR